MIKRIGTYWYFIPLLMFLPACQESVEIIRNEPGYPSLITILGGNFIMGCQVDLTYNCTKNGYPLRGLSVRDFYLSRFEITNLEFCKFLNEVEVVEPSWIYRVGEDEINPFRIQKTTQGYSVETGYEDFPVNYVNWHGAKAYCAWLSKTLPGVYRLPTEVEWEYAARGNELLQFSGSSKSEEVAWHSVNSQGIVHGKGEKKANAFGLYDLSGNMWEWVADCWQINYEGAPANSKAWLTDPCQAGVLRGGGWSGQDYHSGVAIRIAFPFRESSAAVGFRVLRER